MGQYSQLIENLLSYKCSVRKYQNTYAEKFLEIFEGKKIFVFFLNFQKIMSEKGLMMSHVH